MADGEGWSGIGVGREGDDPGKMTTGFVLTLRVGV